MVDSICSKNVFIARQNLFYWIYFLYFKVTLLDYILQSWRYFANASISTFS